MSEKQKMRRKKRRTRNMTVVARESLSPLLRVRVLIDILNLNCLNYSKIV